mmetsp:Transcript_22240/g.55032  ORF Transcript_22240/g.55032 Transcript_22240/m.55032 type:complete len:97 (-) Transcript_22240:4-294(-)
MEVAAAPCVSLLGGGSTLMIDLPPPPPPPKPWYAAEEEEEDKGNREGEREGHREGCFVEIGGASGHPDFLRRVRGVVFKVGWCRSTPPDPALAFSA